MGKRSSSFFFAIRFFCVAMLVLESTLQPEPAKAAGTCGTGSWQSSDLEIHHINIGQGDSTLIVGPTGTSLLFDAGESYWNSGAKAQIIGPYVESVLGCNSLDYVVISHFHLDHIGYVGHGGLWHLVETQGFTVGTTLVRDYNTYLGDISGTFTNWKTYLEGDGQATLHPTFATEGTSQVDLGAGVTFNIVTVNGNGSLIAGDFHGDGSPPSENDYSVGAVLSYGDFDEWIGGDLDGQYEVGGFGYTYHDIELSVAPEVGDVDVYKANHHASSHSSSATFINQLDPEVSIVTVGDGNTYGHPTQGIMDRLLATSTVYMTERGNTGTDIGFAIVAGSIVIKTSDGSSYTVNGDIFTATEPTRTDVDADGYFAEADPNDNSNSALPAPNGGCGPIYQTCSVSCQVTAGEVLINEFLPSPSSGPEWVELYNTTASSINLGYCYIDDIAAGSAAYQIPASTLIPAHGFWTLDRTSYFNNGGDDVRFLKEDASTVLDSYSYGSTGSDLSWYRLPDGGAWTGSPTAVTSKGASNNTPLSPSVSTIVRGLPSPTDESSVTFTVSFSEDVTGVDAGDFVLATTGVTGATITNVSGSGTTYIVTVHTGSVGSVNGTLRLDVVDNDSIRDATNDPLGGSGANNGNFNTGDSYILAANVASPVSLFPPGNYITTDPTPTFTWGSVTDASRYEIRFATDSMFTDHVNSYFVVDPTFTFGGALSDGKYYWQVCAYNILDEPGSWSTSHSFTVDQVGPAAPVLRLPASGVSVRSVPVFRWSAVSGAVMYQFQLDNDSNFSSPLVTLTQRAISRKPAGGLRGTYYWRVRAKDAAGNWGPWSAPFTITVLRSR